jgi:hypothetical protein
MNSTALDVEVISDSKPQQTQALALRPQQDVGLFGTTEPAVVIQKATQVAVALKDVIKSQKLISNISGKDYPRCEAWTLLGTMLGVFPVTVWTKEVEGGWEARVEARTRDGSIIGAAEALCLRSERNWANRDSFALRSMAQTRATAKCLRMPLGFVMTLAGYEATPAEEMVADHPPAAAKPQRATPRRQAPAQQQAAPAAAPAAAKAPMYPSEAGRTKMIAALKSGKIEANALEYFRKIDGCLLPTETLEQLPLQYVPASTRQMFLLNKAIVAFSNGDPLTVAFPPNPIKPEEPKPAPKKEDKKQPELPAAKAPEPAKPAEKPIEVPRDENPDPDAPDAPWRSFPIPFGPHAGIMLANVDKKVLFGFWANWQPSPTWTDRQGNERQTKPENLARDKKFRAMLDESGKHYGFTNPEDEPDELNAPAGLADHEGGAGEPQDGPDSDDDVPF